MDEFNMAILAGSFRSIKSAVDYAGNLEYSEYVKAELEMRRISLSSIDCGRWVYQAQTEEDREEFMRSFGTLEVTFSEMEQFLNVLSGCFRKDGVDKWTIFLKAKMGKEELFSRYVRRLKGLLNGLIGDDGQEGAIIAKILPTCPIKVREYLTGESRITVQLLEKYYEKYEAKQRKGYVRGFETVDRLGDANELPSFGSRVKNEPQFGKNYGEKKEVMGLNVNHQNFSRPVGNGNMVRQCYHCNQMGHISTQCPNKISTGLPEGQVFKTGAMKFCDRKYEVPVQWRVSPMIEKAISVGPIMRSMTVDSGTQVNVIPAGLMSKYEDLNIQVEKIDMRGVGAGEARMIGFMRVPLYCVQTRRSVFEDVYFMESNMSAITLHTALSLGIEVEKEIKDILEERNKMLNSLDMLAEKDSELVKEFIKYHETFDGTIPKPRITVTMEYNEDPPLKLFKPYPLKSDDQIKAMCKYLNDEFVKGRMYPVGTPSIAMPVSIEKRKLRVCNDSRYINRYMKINDVNLPSKDEIQLLISGTKQFSIFDFKDAFKLFMVDDKTAKLSTIVTEFGYWGTNRMQFGLASAPGLFHEKIKELILPLSRNCLNYADDVIFFGPVSEQREAIKSFLKICFENGLIFNVNKVFLYESRVKFLGLLVSEAGLTVDEERAGILKCLEKPDTATEMLSLLGKFAFVIAPLYPQKCEVNYVWTAIREKHFDLLRKCTEEYLTLVVPEKDEVLELVALPTSNVLHVELRSKKGLVDVLMRKLSDYETRYSLLEKELLGISEYVRTVNAFVKNCSIVWKTGSTMVLKMMQAPLELSGVASSRLQTMVSFLVLYGIKCELSLKVKKMLESPGCIEKDIPIKDVKAGAVKLMKEALTPYALDEEIENAQKNLEECQILIKCVSQGKFDEYLKPGLKDKLMQATLVHNILCINSKPMVDRMLAKRILSFIHGETHAAKAILCNEAGKFYDFTGWSTVAEEVLNQCHICMRAKCSNHKRPISWSPPKHARERGHFDLFYIDKQVLILFVDVFSKFTYIGLLKDKKVESFMNFFNKIFDEYKFMYVVSDNEPCLVSEKLTEYFQGRGVFHISSVPYNPRSNGVAERRIAVAKMRIKKFMLEGVSLKKAVVKAMNSMNYFSCSKEMATPAQIYFTNSKSWEPFIPKEVRVPPVRVYFKPKGDQSSLYEEGLIVAKLGTRTNVIEAEGVRYYVGNDFCHFGFTSATKNGVLSDLNNLWEESGDRRLISTIMEGKGDVEEGKGDNLQEEKEEEVVCQKKEVDIVVDDEGVVGNKCDGVAKNVEIVHHDTSKDPGKITDGVPVIQEINDQEKVNGVEVDQSLVWDYEKEFDEENVDQDWAFTSTPICAKIDDDKKMEEVFKNNKNVLMTDGSVKNGHGIAVFGRLGDVVVCEKRRGFLRGVITAPRIEVEGMKNLLSAIVKNESLPSDEKIVVISDNAYALNSLAYRWYERWIKEGVNTRGKPIQHLQTWKEIEELVNFVGHARLIFMHVSGHKSKLHDVCDKLAKGEEAELPHLPTYDPECCE
uniref:CCHC-type domain-containing protein n=1 Tax=Strongyloides papillosus TaxID=174720 RepID=A0A0N5CDT9_STREA